MRSTPGRRQWRHDELPGREPAPLGRRAAPRDSPETSGDSSAGTEPTQPVGYWERRAAEQAQGQEQQGHPDPTTPYPSSGAVFNPTSGQSAPDYWSAQNQDQNQNQPYGQPPYGQPSYQQPSYPPPGGQSGPPPGAAPGYPPHAFSAPRPDHPQATLSLVLGIVGLAGGFACLIGFLVAPFAWALGRNALKDIKASQGGLGGEGSARAGMIMGIVGTVILVLGILVLALVIVVGIASETSSTGSSI